MRIRITSLLLLILLISGCATKSSLFVYRPKYNTGTGWSIRAWAEDQILNDVIHICIDEQEVITGILYEMKTESTFTGKYKDYDIRAECGINIDDDIKGAHKCSLYVNNEHALFISF